MLLLLLSLGALVVGPLVAELGGRTPRAADFLDGLVLVSLCGLVLLHVLPHTVMAVGWPALLASVVGFVLPFLLDRMKHHGRSLTGLVVPVVLGGFAVHAFADGAALVEHDHEHHERMLGLAILLHRLPDGLAIWSVVKPSRGTRMAVGLLALLGMGTIIGFFVGGAVLQGESGRGLALLQAFVAGSVLHIILHRPHLHAAEEHSHGHAHGQAHRDVDEAAESACGHVHHPGVADDRPGAVAPAASAIGALLGLALLVVVTTSHPEVRRVTGELAAGTTFVTLALEAAPALVVAVLAAAIVHAFVPARILAWLGTGGTIAQSARGVLLAPLLPTCSCGAVPLYRTLIAKGAGISAAVALLVAAPEISLSALLISSAMLGSKMTLARGAAAVITALVVARVVGGAAAARESRPLPPPESVHPAAPLAEKLGQGLRAGMSDVLEHTGPWLLLGLAVGALLEPASRTDAIASLSPVAQVPIFALASLPLYVCASGATPLLAVLMHKGLSSGAAVAFLVAGPASNISTFGVLARLHGRRIAMLYATTVAVVATVLGYGVNSVLPVVDAPELHAVEQHAPSPLQVASLALISLLFLLSLLRHGPRHLLHQVLPFARTEASPSVVESAE